MHTEPIASEPNSVASPRLVTRGLSKSFGSLKACEDVSISLGRGEIVALLGENGAGKSTLVKMMFGALAPDSGTIEWEGAPVTVQDPATARRLGIGMVHQHFSLFEAFTVAENIALGLGDSVTPRGIADDARLLAKEYGLALDPAALVADLSVGERQRIEIVRCLLQDPKLVIMDEPTSVLTPIEVEGLFTTLRRLRDEGRTVLYISHKLEEVRELCDRAIVMRAGKVVRECNPREESARSLAAAMVGKEIGTVRGASDPLMDGEVLIELRGVSHDSAKPFGTSLKNISLVVRAGEVVGIAGVAGNGQGELFSVLSGEMLIDRPDAIWIAGQPAGRLGIAERRRLGAAFVPEQRLGHAAVPELPLSENTLVSRHSSSDGTIGTLGTLNRRAARSILGRIVEAMDVRKSAQDPAARALSGGNLQKFVVGRELDRDIRVLIIDQPTWGVDAGAAANIQQALIDLARQGAAVLVVSQDLDELLQVSDRLGVLSDGRLTRLRNVRELPREEIGVAMASSSAGAGWDVADGEVRAA